MGGEYGFFDGMEEFVRNLEMGTLIAASFEDSRCIVVTFIFVLRFTVCMHRLAMYLDIDREARVVFDSFETSDLPLLSQKVIIEPVTL